MRRFRVAPNQAMMVITNEKYTVDDARKRREPREYSAKIMRAARDAELSTSLNILSLVYNGMDAEFQRLPLPTATTPIDGFLQIMEEKKTVWWTLAARNQGYRLPSYGTDYRSRYRGRQTWKPTQNQRQDDQSYEEGASSRRLDYPNLTFSKQPYTKPEAPQQSQRPPIAAPKERLAIVGPPKSNKPYWQQKRGGNALGKQRAYQAEVTSDNEEDNTMFNDYEPEASIHDDDDYEMEDEAFVNFIGISSSCTHCTEQFPSNNKLHKHIREGCPAKGQKAASPASQRPLPATTRRPPKSAHTIVQSKVQASQLGDGNGFRSWNYLEAVIQFFPSASTSTSVCLDTGCGSTLADKDWIMSQIPRSEIKSMANPLHVRGIGAATHLSKDYIHVPFYFPGTNNDGKPVLAEIRREVHLVEGLKAKMLVGNDILVPEGFVLDLSNKAATISSCDTKIRISLKPRGQFISKRVLAAKDLVIPPWTDTSIEVNLAIPADRDFIFLPGRHSTVTFYYHMVDAGTNKIFARNNSPSPTRIPRRTSLGLVSEIEYGNCFQISDCSLDMKLPGQERLSKKLTPISSPSAKESTLSSIRVHQTNQPTRDIFRTTPNVRPVIPLATTAAREETLDNGVKIYGSEVERKIYTNLVAEFPSLWKDDGFIKVPPEEWMRIPLKEGWQEKLTGRSKIYPLGIEDRKLVDEMFDKMHKQGRLKWTDEETPFSFPVFVVWKWANGKRKGRAVVDIRGLNNMIIPDAYPVPLQDEIINDLRGCNRLSILDAMSFFYQWRVHDSDTFKLTIVTHRGQETFLVPVMGCRNSIAYVQRRMDRLYMTGETL